MSTFSPWFIFIMDVYIPPKDTEVSVYSKKGVYWRDFTGKITCSHHVALWLVRTSQYVDCSFWISLHENRYTGGGTQIRSLSLPKEERHSCQCLHCIAIPVIYTHTSGWCHHLWDHNAVCCYQGSLPHCSCFPHYCVNLKMKLSLDSSVSYLQNLLHLGLFIVKDSRKESRTSGKKF